MASELKKVKDNHKFGTNRDTHAFCARVIIHAKTTPVHSAASHSLPSQNHCRSKLAHKACWGVSK